MLQTSVHHVPRNRYLSEGRRPQGRTSLRVMWFALTVQTSLLIEVACVSRSRSDSRGFHHWAAGTSLTPSHGRRLVAALTARASSSGVQVGKVALICRPLNPAAKRPRPDRRTGCWPPRSGRKRGVGGLGLVLPRHHELGNATRSGAWKAVQGPLKVVQADGSNEYRTLSLERQGRCPRSSGPRL